MINIKLDKCGGLTEAMRMIDWCRHNGLQAMVGNMIGYRNGIMAAPEAELWG